MYNYKRKETYFSFIFTDYIFFLFNCKNGEKLEKSQFYAPRYKLSRHK